MVQRCLTCKHWERDVPIPGKEDWHKCLKMPFHEVTGKENPMPEEEKAWEFDSALYFTHGDNYYCADLVTEETYGCGMHEPVDDEIAI